MRVAFATESAEEISRTFPTLIDLLTAGPRLASSPGVKTLQAAAHGPRIGLGRANERVLVV